MKKEQPQQLSGKTSFQKEPFSQTQIEALQQELQNAQKTIKSLQKSNQLYQLVIDHLPHFFTFWKDRDSNFLGCSKRMLKKAGIQSVKDIIGKSDYELPWSKHADAFLNVDQMVMKQNMKKYTVQERHTPVDGKTLWLSTTKVALNNKHGEVIGLVGISEDITEKQILERLLRESENRFRQFSEATFEGVALHKNGIIVDANPVLAQMFNYELDELRGLHLADLNTQEFKELIIKNIETGNTKPFHSVGLRKIRTGGANELRRLDIEITFKNEPIQAIAIRDITEQIKIEKLKDEFLTNTSHELRTPLTGIIGITESLIEGAAGPLPKIVKENLSLIRSSGKRLYGLVNDILDYAKIRQHSLKLQLKTVDLRSIVKMVLPLSQPLIGEKPVILFNRIPDNLPPVLADENRLQQILYNLIGNAIKFTAQGEVVITAKERHNKIEIIVSDTGIGIPNSKQKKIFESFEQIDSSINRAFGGTGLGLTISQQLVNLHGGVLQVANNPQRGSKFFFTLEKGTEKLPEPSAQTTSSPLVPTESTTCTTEFLKSAQSSISYKKTDVPRGSGQSILVIDDEPVNLKVICNFLELYHYRVLTAQSGFQALDILQYEQPDLILLDIMMPRMDGYELCSLIRKSYEAWLLPILFLTARSEVSDLLKGLNSGANDFLTKPFSPEELLSRVSTHLKIKKSVETIKENEQLKTEIKRRKKVELELNYSKKQLAKILDTADTTIVAINEKQEIVYVNQQAESLFGYSTEGILGKVFALLFAPSYQELYQQFINDFANRIKSQPTFKMRTKMLVCNCDGKETTLLASVATFELKNERIFTFVMNPEISTANHTDRQQLHPKPSNLIKDLIDKKQTLHSVENFFDSIIEYLIEGGRDLLPQLRGACNLSSQKQIIPLNSMEYRKLLIAVMTSALKAWIEITGKSKVELAEISGLWRVYLDHGVFKTRTLDKYLKIEQLPQRPRWNNVIATAQFVINHCSPSNLASMYQLKDDLHRLSSMINRE